MVPWRRFHAEVRSKTAASRLVQTATGKELVNDDSLVGVSQANGLAEGAVKDFKGVIRSMRWTVEQLHGVVLDSAGPVVWCVMQIR